MGAPSWYLKSGDSYAIDWYNLLLSLTNQKAVSVSGSYRKRVLDVKTMFEKDPSGLAGTLADFMINAATVDYKIETGNESLNQELNKWASNLNINYKSKISVGLKALAKEYFRERWKGSSQIVTRTLFEDTGDFILPTQAVIMAGEDIVAERDKQAKVYTLDNINYYFRISGKEKVSMESSYDENLNGPAKMIFVRKPYESWDATDAVPFAVRRGIYQNVSMLEVIWDKTGSIVKNFVDYLFQVLLGNAESARKNMVPGPKELTDVKETIKKALDDAKSAPGKNLAATPYDVELKHLVPPYEEVLKQSLYSASVNRILSAYGVLEIQRSERQEDILNPKPMLLEIEAAMDDFCSLVADILKEVAQRNLNRHPKYFTNREIKVVRPPVVKGFVTRDLLEHIRSAYDRGDVSKETYASIFGIDFKVEINRRTREFLNGLEEIMYPHLTQNQEQYPDPEKTPTKEEETDPTKIGPEKRNYTNARKIAKQLKDYEEAPYKTNQDLPKSVKGLPNEAQTLWRKTFNSVLADSGDEDKARKIAWYVVKKKYKKEKDKWVPKSASVGNQIFWLGNRKNRKYVKTQVVMDVANKIDTDTIEKDRIFKLLESCDFNELAKIRKLKLAGKQEEILKLLEEKEKELKNE